MRPKASAFYIREKRQKSAQFYLAADSRQGCVPASIEGVVRNGGGSESESAPHIVNLSFPGVRSEVLLHALEESHIYVSAGSACSSSHPTASHTLKAMHTAPQLLESALRFSFCADTRQEEVDAAVAKLQELVPKLRRYTRR